MHKQEAGRHGCLWAALIFSGIVVFTAVALAVIVMAVRGTSIIHHDGGGYGQDECPVMTEVWSCGEGDTKVVRVPIAGFIALGQEKGMFGYSRTATETALLSIRRATLDPDVQAIILDIDSGGGGITASDILYNALLEFKDAQPGRKVVAVCGDVAASGAYYIAMASDHIVAHPTTITGSIGVIMQTLNIADLAAKIGVKDVTIKSGANKDMLNPFEAVSDEQRGMLQGIIDDLHSRFVSLVCEGRNLPEEQVRALADGRIMTAPAALDSGLIDSIGYWEDAVDVTAELLGVEAVKVYRYEEGFSFSSLFRAGSGLPDVSALLNRAGEMRFLYMWRM